MCVFSSKIVTTCAITCCLSNLLASLMRNHFSETTVGCTASYFKAKQKYQGMFETQKSGNKTGSGEICLNIRTLASSKVLQNYMMFILLLLPPHHNMRQCIALFAVAEGWLFLEIG